MCRLFVFAKTNNLHPDPALDWTKFKRGDVIDILEDGQHGGNEAENSDIFRIIELPGVPASALKSLIMGDPVEEGSLDFPRLRANRINLDALEAGARPREKITKDVAAVLAVRSTVPRTPKNVTLG